MKLFTLPVLLIFAANLAFGQTLNLPLQQKLGQMYKEDQKWRKEFAKVQRHEPTDFDEDTIQSKWQQADSVNMIDAKSIFKRYGYPGYSLVGENGSSWFWAIIQHCDSDPDFQQQVLTKMGNEVKHHNADGENYALLTDRVLANTGHKQLYGTQARYNPTTHKATPLPIQDPAHVDARRKAVGMGTLAAYLKELEGGN